MMPRKSALDFDRVRICRREEQIEAAKVPIDTSVEQGGMHFCFIQGETGSGKGLICQELQVYCQQIDAFFLHGVYSCGRADTEPFCAIADAVGEMYSTLVTGPDSALWKERFDVGLGERKAALALVIPAFRDYGAIMVPPIGRLFDVTVVLNLAYAIREFLRILQEYKPVVWCLEELDFSTICSMVLTEVVVHDAKTKRMCFVGTWRSQLSPLDGGARVTTQPECAPQAKLDISTSQEEDDEGCIVMCDQLQTDTLVKFRGTLPKDRVTEILLDPLGVWCVLHMIRDLLALENDKETNERLFPLASVVHRKTGGNFYFVKHTLREIEKRKLVKYNPLLFRWEWEAEEIKSEINFAGNLIDSIVANVRSMPDVEQKALIYASLLDSIKFDSKILIYAFEEGEFDSMDALERSLLPAVDDGILEKLQGGRYMFAHPKVFESVCSLAVGNERAKLHLAVGRRLLQIVLSRSKQERDQIDTQTLKLYAVGQLNRGVTELPESERVWLAKLDYEAAELAVKGLNFFASIGFLEKGIALVNEDVRTAWKEHHDLMIGMTSLMARMKFSLGLTEEAISLLDIILQKSNNVHDKHDAYQIKCVHLMRSGRVAKAFQTLLAVLKELDVNFPTHFTKLRANSALKKIQLRLVHKSDDELLDLGGKDEGPLFDALDFVIYLRELAVLRANMDSVKLIQTWMAETTLSNGPASLNSVTFATWASWFAKVGDFALADRFGKLAMTSAKKQKDRDIKIHSVRATLLYYINCHHWKSSYQDCLDPFHATNKEVMERGLTELIGVGAQGYIAVYFCSGLNLNPLERDLERVHEKLGEYGFNSDCDCLAPILQLIRNLLGKSRYPELLSGDVLVKDKFLETYNGKLKHWEHLENLWTADMVLSYTFGNFGQAYDNANRLKASQNLSPSAWIPYRMFYHGCTCFALARSSMLTINKYKREGVKITKQFKNWVDHSAVNCFHMYKLLLAEQASVTGESQAEVQKLYDEAIASAARLGFLQDRSLANERAGLYFLCAGDEEWAGIYLFRAHTFYAEWGAKAKTDQLGRDYKCVLENASGEDGQLQGTMLKAKSRMDFYGKKSDVESRTESEFP